jgi:hypothetical protein|tara:strand:+ start:237 stop:635 length:399 start_codon:yes stop_codon:yes gene_type:complete
MKIPNHKLMRVMLTKNVAEDLKKHYMQLSNNDTLYEFLKEYSHKEIPLISVPSDIAITTDGSEVYIPKGNDNVNLSKSILIEYPDEDLYEDGELSDDIAIRPVGMPISEVEEKIIRLWRTDKIVIARWEDLG